MTLLTPPRMTARQLTSLTSRLADLLDAGIPVMDALRVLSHGEPRRSASSRLLESMREQVGYGESLSSAMRRYPQIFNAMYLRLVILGEAGGQLAPMLQQLAKTREQATQQREQWRQALIYPGFVAGVACCVVAGLMLWAVPAFEQLFEGFGTTLPPLTRAILGISRGVAHYAPGVLALAATGSILIWHMRRRSSQWRHRFDQIRLSMPVIGSLCRQYELSVWAAGLTTLLQAGLPLVEALSLLGQGSGHPVYDRACQQLAECLRSGELFSSAMRRIGLFPHAAIEIVSLAEKTGSLERMLHGLAERTSHDVQRRLKQTMRFAEPLIITVCGGFVAVLVMALYMPIIELGNVV